MRIKAISTLLVLSLLFYLFAGCSNTPYPQDEQQPFEDETILDDDLKPETGEEKRMAKNMISIAVNQAGYMTSNAKTAFVICETKLDNNDFSVKNQDGSVVLTKSLEYVKNQWNKEVYIARFDELKDGRYYLTSNGEQSVNFNVKENVYSDYLIDFISFYRMQRSGVDTRELMNMGQYAKLAENPMVQKALHVAAHTDDLWDAKKEKHFDVTGGWYDAGDYGIYSDNQWTIGHMGLAWLEGNETGALNFDFDGDGIPDLLNELLFAGNYLVKMIDAFDGYGYSKHLYSHTDDNDLVAWEKPEWYTDRVIYDKNDPDMIFDDRYATNQSVEGGAKIAASLAILSRVFEKALADGVITAEQLKKFDYDQKNLGVHDGSIDNLGNVVEGKTPPKTISILEAFKTRAVKAYETAKKYDGAEDHPKAGYISWHGLKDCLVWAEAELYLMDKTNGEVYMETLMKRVREMTSKELYCTNYWIVAQQALLSIYWDVEERDEALADHIYNMLKDKVAQYQYGTSDNPYGLYSAGLSSFGVNEAMSSFLGDMMRLVKVIEKKDPDYALTVRNEIYKGLDYMFGSNPWNLSFSSGIGENSVKFLHTALDEEAFSKSRINQQGISIPSAMVAGPLTHAPFNENSVSPWYSDLACIEDGPNQWRYNEYSVSLQSGLFYTIMVLAGEK